MDSMTEGTDEESDGLDDAEFLAEHQKYIDQCDARTADLLKAEHEREAVLTPPYSIFKGSILTYIFFAVGRSKCYQ